MSAILQMKKFVQIDYSFRLFIQFIQYHNTNRVANPCIQPQEWTFLPHPRENKYYYNSIIEESMMIGKK